MLRVQNMCLTGRNRFTYTRNSLDRGERSRTQEHENHEVKFRSRSFPKESIIICSLHVQPLNEQRAVRIAVGLAPCQHLRTHFLTKYCITRRSDPRAATCPAPGKHLKSSALGCDKACKRSGWETFALAPLEHLVSSSRCRHPGNTCP